MNCDLRWVRLFYNSALQKDVVLCISLCCVIAPHTAVLQFSTESAILESQSVTLACALTSRTDHQYMYCWGANRQVWPVMCLLCGTNNHFCVSCFFVAAVVNIYIIYLYLFFIFFYSFCICVFAVLINKGEFSRNHIFIGYV